MASILKDFVASRIPIIWVYSVEESRLLQEEANFLLPNRDVNKLYVYDATNQIYDLETADGGDLIQSVEVDSPVDAIQAFTRVPEITDYGKSVIDGRPTWEISKHGFPCKSVLVMLDAPFYMTDPNKVKHTNARLTRVIKNAANILISQQKSIVFVNHHTEIPVEIEYLVTYVEHPLPTAKTMKSVVRGCQTSVHSDKLPPIALDEDELDKVAQQMTGLTQLQAENVLALASMANGVEYLSKKTTKRTFKHDILRREKTRLIQKSGVLQIVDADWGMDQVGGMENLKEWAKDRALVFTHKAREDGIDIPKGLCVVGPGGTGKSWVAQALGQEWDRTVLRLDIGACMGSLLGESESRLIKALKDSEAQAPCILFVDSRKFVHAKLRNEAGRLRRQSEPKVRRSRPRGNA